MAEAMKLKELIAKHGSIKGRVTKFKNNLDILTSLEQISDLEVSKLSMKLTKCEALFVEFDEVQNLIEVNSSENLDSELVTRDLIEQDFYHCLALAQELIKKNSTAENCNNNNSQGKSSLASCHQNEHNCNPLGFSLPVIKIPNFDGTYFKWLEFKETYMSLVHNNDRIESIHKFHYLQSYLEGEAARVIANLEVSHNNYTEAWKLLCERYDNKRQLINNHLKALFNINSIQETDKSLRYIIDHVTKNLRALNTLGLPTDKWDVLVIYIIAGKLNNSTYFKWEEHRNHLSEIPSLSDFFSFLKSRADVLETVNRHKQDGLDNKQRQFSNNNNQNKSNVSKSLVTTSNEGNTSRFKPECLFCKNNHRLFECPSFKTKSVEDRLNFVSSNNLCETCLRAGHLTSRCRLSGTCRFCKSRHNSLLHKPKETESVNTTTLSSVCSPEVLLCTAKVKVTNPATNESMVVRALLDSGSQSTIITQAVKRCLNLTPQPSETSIVGIGNTKLQLNTERCILRINSQTTSFNVIASCLVLPEITGNLPKSYFDIKQLNISGFQLADPTFNKPSPVDILIGADLFWDIISAQQHSLGCGYPKLQASKLGWLVTGPLPRFNENKTKSVMCNFVSKDENLCNVQDELTKFWELETFPHKKPLSTEEKLCEQHYLANTTRTDSGQFCVSLPLRDGVDRLGDSYNLAKKRFLNLEARFLRQPTLKKEYCQFIDEYEALGHLSESPVPRPLNAYFLPHHPVIKEQSESTKLRVVFDASARTTSGISVNDLQMVGPVVQEPLFNILVRFRQHKYVLTGDVEKMFRSVLLNEADRDLQLILWRDSKDNPIRVLRLNTVTYGFASASFLTTRCLWQIGEESADQQIKTIIQNDFYCDDLLTGASTEPELRHIHLAVSSELSKGGFHLRKFRSNLPELLADSVDLEKGNLMISKATSTLGVGWTPSTDELHFQHNIESSDNVTKRIILSSTFKIFDPLGLLSIFTIKPKILLQEIWSQKIDWDEPIPPEIEKSWLQFANKSSCLSLLKIPRCTLIDKPVSTQIHCFSDASQRAYGSCIYLRSISSSGAIQVVLVCAKSRVAPIKPTTIPRLELCAALLGAQLCSTVIAALRCPIERQVYWTDSQVVLGWLNSNKTKTFVTHRVAAINELTNPADWRYVPTSVNPADLVSRGVDPDHSDLSIWWHGPPFLSESEDSWPAVHNFGSIELPELKIHQTLVGEEAVSMPSLSAALSKFSKLTTLTRVLTRVLRFVNNCRTKIKSNRLQGPLQVSELEKAHDVLIKLVQQDSFATELALLKKGKCLNFKTALSSLTPFLDENGILRVGGRIDTSNYQYDKRHPILLHSSHYLSKLIFKQEHIRLLHAGPQHLLASIRERYWPVGGRTLARRVARECVTCRRFNARTMENIMGNLPVDRVQPDFPFSTVGTDFAGPFLITDRKGRGCKISKCYLCIFICFRYKCIHLELVSQLSMDAFILTLKRFIARRGKPKIIYCDNGRNFVAANKEINSFLNNNTDSIIDHASREGIEFRFSPAYAPHFGGYWESGVKSAKFHLHRVIKNVHLTFEELSSLFVQIEAILNSRPLCPISPSPQDLSPLTPGHFLIGRPLTSLPSPYLLDYSTNRLDRFQRLEQARQDFWKRWSMEYVAELQQRTKWKRNTDWVSASNLLKGVYETMIRCPYIMHWQQVKTLLNTIQALIVSDSNNTGENLSSASAALMSQPPPSYFCSTVVRLLAIQVVNTGDSYSIEQMCGGTAIFPSAEKTENMLMNLLMPLCLRIGSGRKDTPPLRQSDVNHLISVILNALCPPAPPGQLAAVNAKLNAADARANSLTFTGSRDTRNTTRLSNQLYRIAFLSLKVMCSCFTSELCSEWGRIARAMRDLGRRNEAAHHLWDFLEHVVTYRTPLYILLQPFIVHKLSQPPIGDNERHMQFVVRERVRGLKLPAARARGTLLADLARELKLMRESYDQFKYDLFPDQIAENLGQGAGKRASEVFPRTNAQEKHQQHRPSLISMLVGRGSAMPRTPDHPSAPLSAQRESVSSGSTTSQHMQLFEAMTSSGRASDISNNHGSSNNSHMGSTVFGSDTKPAASTPSFGSTQTKLRFVPSVEFKLNSGENSMSPLSPLSPRDPRESESDAGNLAVRSEPDHDSEPGDRPRLQRAHGPSKKTFKFRRSRNTKPDMSHARMESDECSSPGPDTTPLRRVWSQPPLLAPAAVNTDTSYDSEISQTSSTSGYRESYSLQASMTESPGGSLRAALASPDGVHSATPRASPDGNPAFLL